MQVFRKVIVLTTKPRFDVKGTVRVSARLAIKDKNLGKPAVDMLQRKSTVCTPLDQLRPCNKTQNIEQCVTVCMHACNINSPITETLTVNHLNGQYAL